MNLFMETAEMRARRTATGEGASAPALWQVETRARDTERQPNQTDAAHESAVCPENGTRAIDEVRPDSSYSLEQESYQAERAYDRRRVQRHRMLVAVRTFAAIVLVPVALAAVFLASYTLTCIVSGATPQEVVELLQDLLGNVIELVRTVIRG